MPSYVNQPDVMCRATYRLLNPAGEVTSRDSHSRNQTRMRPLSTATRCESRITEGRRSRNSTSAVQDGTLQLLREIQREQAELTKRAMDERAEEARRAKDERAEESRRHQELMDKYMELVDRSRHPTPQPASVAPSQPTDI